MKYKKQPYCCAECCYARFLKFPKPLCIITNREFTHNTAKNKAEWCPIKGGFNSVNARNGAKLYLV